MHKYKDIHFFSSYALKLISFLFPNPFPAFPNSHPSFPNPYPSFPNSYPQSSILILPFPIPILSSPIHIPLPQYISFLPQSISTFLNSFSPNYPISYSSTPPCCPINNILTNLHPLNPPLKFLHPPPIYSVRFTSRV